METFKVIKEENGVIISILRMSDNKIFTIGDNVDLAHRIEEGTFEGRFIEEFQVKEGGNKWFKDTVYPRGTIITNTGVITLDNAEHTNFESEQYLLMNTEYFSIKELLHIFNFKKKKQLIKLAKLKRDGKH